MPRSIGARTGLFGRRACLLRRLSKLLSFVTDGFKGFPVPIAKVTRVISKTSKSFGFFARDLAYVEARFLRIAMNGRPLAIPFTDDTNTFGLLPPVFGSFTTRFRVLSKLLGRSPVILCAHRFLGHAATSRFLCRPARTSSGGSVRWSAPPGASSRSVAGERGFASAVLDTVA